MFLYLNFFSGFYFINEGKKLGGWNRTDNFLIFEG